MIKRLVIAFILSSCMFVPNAIALDPVKLVSVISKIMKMNAGRAVAAGRVHRGSAILTSEQLAAREAAAVIARARLSSKVAVKVASSAPAAAASTRGTWLAVAVALGVSASTLTEEKSEVQVAMVYGPDNAASFQTDLLSPWPLQPIVPKPLYDVMPLDTNFNVGVFSTRPILRMQYTPPDLYKIGVIDTDNPRTQFAIFEQHLKNLPSSGFVVAPFGSLVQDPFQLVRLESPVIHCYDPSVCQKEFIRSLQFQISKNNVTTNINIFTSDLLLETERTSPFFDAYRFSYIYNYSYTDFQGSHALLHVDTDTEVKEMWIRRLSPMPKIYPDTLTMLEEAPHIGNAETSTELIADMLNRLWRKTDTMQETESYQADFPVTKIDVENAIGSSFIPLVELIAPAHELKPIVDPCLNAVNLCANLPKDNFGDDPGIPPPTLEDIPTVPMILDPIFGLFPSLKRYRFAPTAQCPTAEFDAFNHHFFIDQHCAVTESSRGLWAMFAACFWSFCVLRVVLK